MAGKTKLKAGCGVVGVFAAGFLCGFLVLFLLLVKIIPLSEGWRDEESKEFVLDHLASRLKLTGEQIEQARPLVHEALEERYEHRRTYIEADIALTGAAFEKLRPILTEEQISRAEKMFENWKKGKRRFLEGTSRASSDESEPD